MTIDDLIPDKEPNLGGRPKNKETTDGDEKFSTKSVEGEAFTVASDGEEWWRNTMLKCLGYREFPYNDDEKLRAIEELSNFTFLVPVEVRTQLDKHGIFETDWKEYLANNPHLFGDRRLPEEWMKKTDGQDYMMSDTIEVEKEKREPYYKELENPDQYRSNKSATRSSTTSTPTDGAFSDLINNSS